MGYTISLICTIVLIILVTAHFFRAVTNKDHSLIFSPITIISLVYVYYCVIPFFTSGNERYQVGPDVNTAIFHFAALLSYICILTGFRIKVRADFKKWNKCFHEKNVLGFGILFFTLAFVGYSAFRGVHFSIFADDDVQDIVHDNMEHYFIELIYLYEAAFSLFLVHNTRHKGPKWYYILMIYVLIAFIFAGTRARIVILLASALTTFHLYPRPRKVKYALVIILALVTFFGFSIMDRSRQYSRGLDKESIENLSYRDIKSGADENAAVYWFSTIVMDWVTENGEYVYFEPLVNALLSPVPRSLFPWKPDGRYLMDAQVKMIGTADHGAIFLNFTEGYYSFGWFGVVLYGLILGWLAKLFWTNYKNNPSSIGACLALALFCGFSYNVISRGYLATALINYIYIICLPFWLAKLSRRIFKRCR